MSELLGSIRTFPMWFEFLSPLLLQLFPPSVDLYTPSPYPTLRWLLFSPVPTHTTSGFFGSTATVPIEYDAWASKTGVQVVPAFTVFHTPPECTATYQVLLSEGCTATSPIRPEGAAGPMFRSLSPAKRPARMRSVVSGSAGFWPAAAAGADAGGAGGWVGGGRRPGAAWAEARAGTASRVSRSEAGRRIGEGSPRGRDRMGERTRIPSGRCGSEV